MVKRYLNIFISLLLLSLSFYFPSPAEGKWDQNGAPVTKGGIASKMYPSITGTGDGSGSAFVAWEELSVNPGDIYVQKIDVNGTPLFDSDMDVTVDDSASKQYPTIVNDGSGGAFVVWEDNRNGSDTDIYIQRIDKDGIPQFKDLEGNTIDKVVCSASGNQWSPRLALTSDGDVIVAWEDHRSSVSQIYAQRIDKSSGSPVWTTPNGIAVSAASGNQFSPAISSDGYDGAVVVWEDQRNLSTTGSDIYIQRIDSSGTGQWASDKIAATNAAGDQWFPAIATDGQNSFIITWEDYRIDGIFSDIYAKGIDYGGFPLFEDKAICSINTPDRKDVRHPAVAYSTNEDSFIIAWEDYRSDPNYTSDMYAQKINYAGNLFWASNGSAVSTSNDYQEAISITSNDSRGVIAAWQDIRSETDYDIYSIPLPIPGYVTISSLSGDEVSTTEADVNLALSATSIGDTITDMRLRNDDAPDWSNDSDGWETYSTTKTGWPLTNSEGVRTVYAQFRDADGNISSAYFDDIALSYIPTGSISINEVYNSGTNKYTDSTSVNLTISATNADSMSFSNDKTTWSSWEAYSTTKSGWSLTSGDEQKTVYVRFKDQYDNIPSNYPSDNITLDTTAPTGTSVTITSPITAKDGITYTNSPTITLALSATDGAGSGVSRVIFNNNNSGYWGNHTNCNCPDTNTTIEWDLNYPYPGDGTKKVYAKFMDNVNYARLLVDDRYPAKWGNVIVSNSVILDTTAPAGSISITGSGGMAGYTNSNSVSLTLSATDSSSGMDKMRFSNDGTTWDPWEPYNTYKSWALSIGNGTKTVYAQFKDVAGNTVTYSANIILDTEGPTGSISINGGDAFTNSIGVTLTVSATDATSNSTQIQIRFSNDNSSWSNWEAYGTPKTWNIPAGDEVKTVYVQFKDNLENISTYSDTITLDTGIPTAGSIIINNYAPYTTITDVTLSLSAIDPNLSQMQFSNDNSIWSEWEDYSTTKNNWTLDSGDGLKTIYIQFKDTAENISQSYSDDISLDTAPPTGSITINSDATYTNSTDITLAISCMDSGSGCSQMQFSNDNSTWSTPEDYATTAETWDLSSIDEIKIVYVKFKDNAGNWSTSEIKDTITLDASSPTVASTTPTNGATSVSADTTLIAIVFGEAIDTSTISSSNAFLKEGESIINASLSYDNTTWTLTLTPEASLSEYTTYTVVVTTSVRDVAANPMTEPYSFSFTTADVTKPTSTISSPANDSIISTVSTPNITGTSSDIGSTGLPGSGVSIVEVSINGIWQSATDTTSWTCPLPAAEGTYTIQTKATDSAGNVEDTGTSITITVDNTPPIGAITINGGAADTNTLDVTLTISASDTGSGVAKMQYGDALKGNWGTYAESANITLHSGEGTKTIYIQFMDAAGNTSEIYYDTINFDTIAPDTSITSQPSNPSNSTSPSFSFTSSEAGTFECQLDSGGYTSCTSPKSYTEIAQGSHTFYVRAIDGAGNADILPASYSWVISTTVPALTIDAVITPTNASSQTITGTVEAGASVYVTSDTAASDGAATVSGTSWSYTITGLVEGANNITVTVTDTVGNNATITSSITMDITPPQPEGTSPAVTLEGLVVVPGQANPSYSYSNFTVSWPSYSDSAGIKEYEIAVGDAAGATNVKSWLSVGTETSASTGDLQSLFETYKNANGEYFGKTFYLSVKAIDASGNESTVLSVPFVYTPAEINSKAGDRDGTVDGFDLGMLGIAYDPFGSVPSGYEAADINRDGKVDNDDLFILAVNFGKVKQ